MEADDGGALYRQCAVCEPHGLTGQLYWAAGIYPYHGLVFGGMVSNIANAADLRRAPRIPR